MVIVVQLLSSDQQAPRHDVRRRVRQLEAPVPHVVAQAVDDPCGQQWLGNQLHAEHGNGRYTE